MTEFSFWVNYTFNYIALLNNIQLNVFLTGKIYKRVPPLVYQKNAPPFVNVHQSESKQWEMLRQARRYVPRDARSIKE